MTVSMECKAPKGLPEPTLWWEKNGVQVRANKNTIQIHSNGTLVISNVSLHDIGEYVCVAKNDAGYKYSSAASLSVFEKPSFLLKPDAAATKFESGTRADLKCEANGYPKPQIEWKKDNSIESLPLKAQITDSGVLQIPNLQLEDEGEYTCVASNQLGTVESKAYLFVYERPSFVKQMPNATIGIETKSLTIECNAKGKPQPIIYWAKSAHNKDQSLMATQDDFIILENGNLFIEHLSAKYEGTYLCQASNEHGNIEAKTHVQVKSVHQARPPPLVVYWPQNQTIPINTQANLECFAASPANIIVNKDKQAVAAADELSSYIQQHPGKELDRIIITWFKNNQLISVDTSSFDAKFRLLETGTLEINSVSK
jgi:roundabout axon guidance receptor 2